MIITLVRHGEVDTNFLGCYNGHNDIGLSPQGKKEALSLAKQLQQHPFDAVYSSDLRRTRESALPIIKALPETTPHFFTSRLREKSWGRHEGKTFDAITSEEALVYENFLQWIYALDGENYEEYILRIEAFFTQELPLTPYNNVLVITHAGVIRVLIHLLQKISLEAAFSINFPYSASITLDTSTWKFGDLQCVS